MSLEPDGIETEKSCPGAGSYGIWRNVLADAAEPSHHRIGADPRELVDREESPDDGIVFDGHMSCEGCRIRHDDVAAEFAVMGDVRVGHEKVVVTDDGHTVAAQRGPVHGRVLPDGIPVPDDDARLFVQVLGILRREPDAREGVYRTFFPDLGLPFNDHMGDEPRSPLDVHLSPDDAEGTDHNVLVDSRFSVDDRRGVDILRHYSSLPRVFSPPS